MGNCLPFGKISVTICHVIQIEQRDERVLKRMLINKLGLFLSYPKIFDIFIMFNENKS